MTFFYSCLFVYKTLLVAKIMILHHPFFDRLQWNHHPSIGHARLIKPTWNWGASSYSVGSVFLGFRLTVIYSSHDSY